MPGTALHSHYIGGVSCDSHVTNTPAHMTPMPREASALRNIRVVVEAVVLPVEPSTRERVRGRGEAGREMAVVLNMNDRVRLIWRERERKREGRGSYDNGSFTTKELYSTGLLSIQELSYL